MKTILIFIQARMGSKRLPKKVLMEINGKPMLHWIVRRMKMSHKASKIIIGTTKKPSDDAIARFARKERIRCYRGSEMDIVDRCYQAAKLAKADVLVRITADCPLADARLIDEMLEAAERGKYDYYSNVNPPTYPDGLDIDIVTFRCLERLWVATRGYPFPSEWFKSYIMQNPQMFRIGNHFCEMPLSDMRWTVDYYDDLLFIRAIYQKLRHKNGRFFMDDILEVLKAHPNLLKINKRFQRDKSYYDAIRENKRLERMVDWN